MTPVTCHWLPFVYNKTNGAMPTTGSVVLGWLPGEPETTGKEGERRMEEYRRLLRENEYGVNRLTAALCRYQLYVLACIWGLNVLHVFSLAPKAGILLVTMNLMPLLLPTVAVVLLKLEHPTVKYLIITCAVVSSGICYALITFRATLVLLFPTLMAALYYDRKALKTVIAETAVNIFASHMIGGQLAAAALVKSRENIGEVIRVSILPHLLIYAGFAAVFWILTDRTARMIRDIYTVTVEKEVLMAQSAFVDRQARMEEREKISRDIHNSVGHTITAAIVALEAAEAVSEKDPEAAAEKIRVAEMRMRGSLQVIRKTVRLLDEEDAFLPVSELVRTLTLCVRQFELDTEANVIQQFDELEEQALQLEIPSTDVQFLYGALQECLTNSVRHGHATEIRVALLAERSGLTLTVQDNGSGAGESQDELLASPKGFGLQKMESYLAKAGGTLRTENRNGFRVELTLPRGEV